MNDFDILVSQMKGNILEFLSAIQVERKVDEACFHRVHSKIAELSRVLKGQALISKGLLSELWTTIKIMRNEAPFINNGKNELNAMADRIQYLFELILKGESPEDRIPGVPRTI